LEAVDPALLAFVEALADFASRLYVEGRMPSELLSDDVP
jgi:hypothetical protein